VFRLDGRRPAKTRRSDLRTTPDSRFPGLDAVARAITAYNPDAIWSKVPTP
jgi:hypothetical protein